MTHLQLRRACAVACAAAIVAAGGAGAAQAATAPSSHRFLPAIVRPASLPHVIRGRALVPVLSPKCRRGDTRSVTNTSDAANEAS